MIIKTNPPMVRYEALYAIRNKTIGNNRMLITNGDILNNVSPITYVNNKTNVNRRNSEPNTDVIPTTVLPITSDVFIATTILYPT